MYAITAEKYLSDIDWDFKGENTRCLTHCFHDYPARMIPQIAGRLLDLFGESAKRLFDPYCGTGTSLVEAQIRGLDAIGTDINPLANLIAKVKTRPILQQVLDLYLKNFSEFLFKIRSDGDTPVVPIPNFPNIEFWFSPDVIRKLACIKKYICQIEESNVRDFFKLAFSETIRESSLTRNSEFKLFRMTDEQILKFHPDVYTIMECKLYRNQQGMLEYLNLMKKYKNKPKVSVHAFNTVEEIPIFLKQELFDIVITSPPYGDSRTTVAYGQYSRLSSQWLDFECPNLVDKKLMGGFSAVSIPEFCCEPLNRALKRISDVDKKRACEIASFYIDLEKSIYNVSNLVRNNAIVCYVVGNRKVKGETLPTNEAIVSFFKQNKFVHIDTFIRSIPNKRMPAKNSPTNEPGKLDTTMLNEYIVVMRKK